MNRSLFFNLIGMVLVTSCTDLSSTPGAATAPVPTPTPENYGLYTDADLQIYADTIDRRVQEALKSNNTTQAQELGRKRQELIAEFNRRGLKRNSAEITRHSQYSRPVNPRPANPRPVNRPGTGLPGED